MSAIAHAGMPVMSPISEDALDEVVGVFGLRPGARVLDLGCGKGDLLARIGARYDVEAVGVDLNEELLAEARAAAPQARFVRADIGELAERGFDLAASVGAGLGSVAATIERLCALVVPGGLVLLGEGYWRREPSEAYLAALGAARDELADYAGTIALAEGRGLVPLYAVTATVQDFDRYEWRWSLNGERYAAAHPDEDGVDELLRWIRAGRDRYVRLGGRDTLGFGLFLFRVG